MLWNAFAHDYVNIAIDHTEEPMSRFCVFVVSCFVWISNAQASTSVVDKNVPLEVIATDFELADGPAWDGRGSLFFPDVKAGKIFRYQPSQKKIALERDNAGRISATFFNHGQLYLSDNGNAEIATISKGQKKRLLAFADSKKMRPNDLVVDNSGGVYITLTGAGQVVYVTAQGSMTTVIDGCDTPNGITLSPDEKILYVASYKPKQIWRYDIASNGNVNGGRVLAIMDDGPDLGADGMTVDRAGNIYCAGAHDIWIWSPAGKLLDKIACPTRPINCVFGDADMQSLYITGFGGLYRQKMMISGRSPHPPSLPERQPTSASRPVTIVPSHLVTDLDHEYARYGNRRLLMDIIRPEPPPWTLPCLVIVHGGGWLKGDKTKFRALAIQLALHGYATAAIEYRLGGEAHFPAAIHDCNAAVRFLRHNARRFNIDPERIGAVGGSAGGHLVGLMATGHDIEDLQGNGGNASVSSKLNAAVVMAGPMEMITGSVAEKSRMNPEVANCNRFIGKGIDDAFAMYRLADACEHITKDDPPIWFMSGEYDNPDRNARSRERLAAVGVLTGISVYKDGKHGCWNQEPWMSEMVEDLDTFFKRAMAIDSDDQSDRAVE
jgi:sugar lactone lactonase YvrE/acetyl esterase/lipase